MMDIALFKKFGPMVDDENSVPEECGNYIIVLKPSIQLPDIGIKPVFHQIHHMDVIYTGIGKNLRRRDLRQHFHGNAGRLTFRKSLGCLFGFNFIPRDANYANNQKVKFREIDEQTLSKWMHENLLFYYYPNSDYEAYEDELIQQFNPPLNLSKNENPENSDYRKRIKLLRCRKPTEAQSERPSIQKNDDSSIKQHGTS